MTHSIRKIFIGLNNISSQIGDFGRAFNALGIDTLTASIDHKRIVDSSDLDVVLTDQIPAHLTDPAARQRALVEANRALWARAVEECDTFFFMWSSFRNDLADYIQLKEMGKRIVVFFVGSDSRWVPAMRQEFARYNMPPIEYPEGYHLYGDLPVHQLQRVRMAERYADVIYCHPGHGQLALRPYMSSLPPIDVTPFVENTCQRERPLVVHAPSNDAFKGTRYVLPVIEQLRAEGVPFDFELIQNLPYREAIARYSDADILVGQMLAPAGGRQEREAMASGTVVLSSMRYDYPQRFLDDCPAIDVRPDTLYDQLKAIILDHNRRQELARLGRPHVEKNHDVVAYCRRIVEHLETPPEELEYDYVPSFFRHHFVPEHPGVDQFYNRYTRFVQDCPWYAQVVPAGFRDGLRF